MTNTEKQSNKEYWNNHWSQSGMSDEYYNMLERDAEKKRRKEERKNNKTPFWKFW